MFIAQTTIARLNKTGVPGEDALIELTHRTDLLVIVNLPDRERVLYEHMEENTCSFVKLTRSRQGTIHFKVIHLRLF
jgi:hypothetical protein